MEHAPSDEYKKEIKEINEIFYCCQNYSDVRTIAKNIKEILLNNLDIFLIKLMRNVLL